MVAGRFRSRTRLRGHLPWVLLERGLARKPASDCGQHDWYNADGGVEECYHCQVGVRPGGTWCAGMLSPDWWVE